MAMNPQNVLSQLRMMSDQQLQQYAAMHKNDPFIFPLAFQESQTRKQMRSESQAMQAGPQEKVADQALAAMAPEPLPEEVGIGALPAQNLEGMAAGGIVAFDEGGEVPRYQVGGVPSMGTEFEIPGMTQSTILADAKRKYAEGRPLSGVEKALLFASAPLAAGADVLALPFTGAANLIRNPLDKSPRPSLTPAMDARNRALYGDQTTPTAPPMQMGSNLGATDASLGAAGVAALAAGKDGRTGDAGARDQGGVKAPSALPAAPRIPGIAPTAFKPAEAPTIANAKELAGQLLDTSEYKSEIDKYQKAEQDAVDAARKARTEGKPAGKAYEEYESTLREETADLGRQKGDAKAEAWLTAGLAVLGGSSPFALQNLSLAGKGVEQYRDAMKDIRKATRENAKGLADIAQARRSEERGDWEKTQEFEERANTRMSNARKFGIEGLMTLGVKSADLAGRAYDTQVTQAGMDRRTMAELQSRENIANAQIQAQRALAGSSGQLGLFRELGGGDAAKGLGVYANVMGPEAKGLQGLLAKYADPMKLMALKTTDPDLYNYVRAQLSAQIGLPGVMSKPTGKAFD